MRIHDIFPFLKHLPCISSHEDHFETETDIHISNEDELNSDPSWGEFVRKLPYISKTSPEKQSVLGEGVERSDGLRRIKKTKTIHALKEKWNRKF